MDHRHFVESLYRFVLKRQPGQSELAYWMAKSEHELSPGEMVQQFFETPEFTSRRAEVSDLPHAPGHYYSPINAEHDISREKLAAARDPANADFAVVHAIDMAAAEQRDHWLTMAPHFAHFAFPFARTTTHRFYLDNPVFSGGDALVLFAMMRLVRPRRIVEIGSGFSSACMLDTRDICNLATNFSFIDPEPERLLTLLTELDHDRCNIIRSKVQDVPISSFLALEANDILFIDSSHVMKCGSDVNHELFKILPRLSPGVIVHFHDMFFPFEYPAAWLLDRKYSWNEAYGVRAFLMYNTAFRIMFFNDAFALQEADFVRHHTPNMAGLFLHHPGGGLWIRRVA